MREDRMVLVGLIEQGADSDLVPEMLAFAAGRMIDEERAILQDGGIPEA